MLRSQTRVDEELFRQGRVREISKYIIMHQSHVSHTYKYSLRPKIEDTVKQHYRRSNAFQALLGFSTVNANANKSTGLMFSLF